MSKDLVMELPKEVKEIIYVLEQAGYEAYAVGGCVRDSLLLKEPKDYDITTNALPEKVKSLFTRTIDTGLQHGTVTILINKVGYEVTTYRIDGEYEDGRHPKSVEFTASLSEDLRRRDFTINAMAFNDKNGLVDLFSGREDLIKGIIRCVGEADERFSEDALRMLRAVRFAAQLGFVIKENTLEAMKKLSNTLSKVSAERVYTEFYKTLISGHPEYIEIAYDTGLMDVFLPELKECFENAHRRERLLERLRKSENSLLVRETILLSEISIEADDKKASKEAKKILKRLKTDAYTFNTVEKLVELRNYKCKEDEVSVRHFLSEYGEEIVRMHISYLEALDETKKEYIDNIMDILEKVIKRGDCYRIKDLDISGTDILNLGVKKGEKVGETLQMLLDKVIINPELNKKDVLSEMVSKELVGK